MHFLKYKADPSFNLRGLNEIKAGTDVNILERVRKRNCKKPKAFLSFLFIVSLAPVEKQPRENNRIKQLYLCTLMQLILNIACVCKHFETLEEIKGMIVNTDASVFRESAQIKHYGSI